MCVYARQREKESQRYIEKERDRERETERDCARLLKQTHLEN